MTVNPDAVIEIRIKKDRSEARMIIPCDFDPGLIDVSVLAGLAQQDGVVVDAVVQGRLEKLANAFRAAPGRFDEVIAESSVPTKGKDGRLDWVEGFDPEAAGEKTDSEESKSTDHYSGCEYITITAGTQVATLHAPTDGVDGRDVIGGNLKAKPGKAAKVTGGEGVHIDAEGNVIAQVDGVLMFERDVVKVSRVLEIPGDVDFNTGNIDFDGSVIIRGGVCSRFEVKATGDIAVDGLIEAATIKCGGNFQCRLGMAGHEKGTLEVGGDAQVKYLSALTGHVHGNLHAEGGIMRCTLTIGGDVVSDRGTIIGGEVTVTGSIRVATLGSDAETPTSILLGEVPVLESGLKEIIRKEGELETELKEKKVRYETLKMIPLKNLSVDEKEELTLINFEISELESDFAECTEKHQEIEQAIARTRKVHVDVLGAVYPKVMLEVRDQAVQFDRIVKGPMNIGWGVDQQLQFRRGNGPVELLTTVSRQLDQAA